jgi:adenylate cyclase
MKWHFGHKLALVMTSLVLTASCILGYTLVKRQFGMLEKQFCQTGTMLASQLSAGSVERVFTEDQLGLQSLVNSLNNNLPVVSAALINRDCKVLAMDGRQVPLPDEYQKKFLGKSGMFEGKKDIVWFYSPVIFKEVIGFRNEWLSSIIKDLLNNCQAWMHALESAVGFCWQDCLVPVIGFNIQ